MIVTRLTDGLGNQMFQYAVGRRLALKHGTKLLLDTSWYCHIPRGITLRKYQLDNYAIVAKIASGDILREVQPPEAECMLADKQRRPASVGKIWQIVEHKHMPNFDILWAPNNTYLAGYWQNELYFVDVRERILQELTLKTALSATNEAMLDTIKSSNSVAVHVRRGDYVSNPIFNTRLGVIPVEYYQRAADYIRDRVQTPHFFVFSDDLAWCRKNLNFYGDVLFVEGNNESEQALADIRLMQSCKHNIIPNSSFGWWGAWLNDNPGKIVGAPRVWFQDAERNRNTRIVPANWVRI